MVDIVHIFRLMPLALKEAYGAPAASDVILNEKKKNTHNNVLAATK